MTKLVRKNINMSLKIAKWYEEKAKELGVSQSSVMVLALNEYIKQSDAVDVMSNFIKEVKKAQE